MKAIHYILVLTPFIVSCTYHHETYVTTEQFLLNTNSQIQVVTDTIDIDPSPVVNDQPVNDYSVIAGGKTVASYLWTYNQPEWFDEEYGYVIQFEINPLSNSFNIADDSLESIRANYYHWSAWWTEPDHPLLDGYIKGEKKSSSSWYIEWNVRSTPVYIGEEPILLIGEGLFTVQD